MPSQPPPGDPVPLDGSLPAGAAEGSQDRDLGLYVHVPFCRVRCGYCDFNTYVPAELSAAGAGGTVGPATYVELLVRELELSVGVLGAAVRPLTSVFVGGGTPTLLAAHDLGRFVAAAGSAYGLAPDAEVTVEANPDTVTPDSLAELAAAGFTRISLGMQSAVPHMLATLERTHEPAAVGAAVAAARRAGLATSLDLIYGTPGESRADWRRSLEAVIAMEPDHVSAYALVVEEGTPLFRRVARGEIAAPEDDDEADKYELADELLGRAGYRWYEVSNWAATPRGVCRHNLGYWRGADWWGLGPGAHSHVGGVRWWNVRHPRAYGERLAAGVSPGLAREVLTAEQRYDEEVLLRSRLAEGLALALLRPEGRAAVAGLVADGLVEPGPVLGGAVPRDAVPRDAALGDAALGDAALGDAALGEVWESGEGARRVVLTLRGRLLADLVVRRLLGYG